MNLGFLFHLYWFNGKRFEFWCNFYGWYISTKEDELYFHDSHIYKNKHSQKVQRLNNASNSSKFAAQVTVNKITYKMNGHDNFEKYEFDVKTSIYDMIVYKTDIYLQ